MVSHVGFCSIQQPFKFEAICVSVGNHIANLADNGGKDKNTN